MPEFDSADILIITGASVYLLFYLQTLWEYISQNDKPDSPTILKRK